MAEIFKIVVPRRFGGFGLDLEMWVDGVNCSAHMTLHTMQQIRCGMRA